MKKYVIMLLAILLICLAVCSCTYYENVWFDDEVLEKCLVPELPKLDAPYASQDGEDVYAKLTGSERESYAQEVYEYLQSCDFLYLGTRGDQYSSGLKDEGIYVLHAANKLSDFCKDGIYKFVFSDGSLNKSGDIIFSVITIAPNAQGTQTIKNGFASFEYNTVISVRCDNDPYREEKYVDYNYSHETHTLDVNDICIYCGEKVTYPEGIAQIIIDKDNIAKSTRDKTLAEMPGYIAYYKNVCSVEVKMYVFGDAEAAVEKYGLDGLFAKAQSVSDGSYTETMDYIKVKFARDDFTEEIYQRLMDIQNDDSTFKSIIINTGYDEYYRIYLPDINDYADTYAALDTYTSRRGSYHTKYDGMDKTRIIRSADEYQEYVNELMELAVNGYEKEYLENSLEAYDDKFFEKNALIITSTLYGSSSAVKFIVDGVYIADGKAYVMIRTEEGGIGATIVSYYTFHITVRKSELDGIDTAITLH